MYVDQIVVERSDSIELVPSTSRKGFASENFPVTPYENTIAWISVLPNQQTPLVSADQLYGPDMLSWPDRGIRPFMMCWPVCLPLPICFLVAQPQLPLVPPSASVSLVIDFSDRLTLPRVGAPPRSSSSRSCLRRPRRWGTPKDSLSRARVAFQCQAAINVQRHLRNDI